MSHPDFTAHGNKAAAKTRNVAFRWTDYADFDQYLSICILSHIKPQACQLHDAQLLRLTAIPMRFATRNSKTWSLLLVQCSVFTFLPTLGYGIRHPCVALTPQINVINTWLRDNQHQTTVTPSQQKTADERTSKTTALCNSRIA